MTSSKPIQTGLVDPTSLKVQAIVAALQILESEASSAGERGVGEMTLAEVVVALKQVGFSIACPWFAKTPGETSPDVVIPNVELSASAPAPTIPNIEFSSASAPGPAIPNVESSSASAPGPAIPNVESSSAATPTNEDTSVVKNLERTIEQIAASERRLRAIELAFMKTDKASVDHPKRALTTSPVTVSSDCSVATPSDTSDCSDVMATDGSDIALSEFGSVEPSELGTFGLVDIANNTQAIEGVGADGPNVVNEGAGEGRGKFDAQGTLKGFVCHGCKTYNVIIPSGEAWYAVVKGKSVGVYKGWNVVSPMVTGVSHAVYTRAGFKPLAEEIYQEALLLGNVEVRPY